MKVIIFLSSLAGFVISLYLQYISGYVIDEHNLSGASYYGGELGLAVSWLRLLVLLVCAAVSGAMLLKKK